MVVYTVVVAVAVGIVSVDDNDSVADVAVVPIVVTFLVDVVHGGGCMILP